MTTILALPTEASRYIANFQIVAICRYPNGFIAAKTDPKGAVEAWWCASETRRYVAVEARRLEGDIVGAAARIGVVLTSHSVVLARVTGAVNRIEMAIREAQATGDLQFFNQAYKQRRLAARAAGHGFMSYHQARTRFARVLARTAAGKVTTAIISEVFG